MIDFQSLIALRATRCALTQPYGSCNGSCDLADLPPVMATVKTGRRPRDRTVEVRLNGIFCDLAHILHHGVTSRRSSVSGRRLGTFSTSALQSARESFARRC